MIRPGSRTTVEDLGRTRCGAIGVPAGGAFDPAALAEANRRLGNPAAAAGLEALLLGPVLENAGTESISIALEGAFCAPRIATSPRADDWMDTDPAMPFAVPPGGHIDIGTISGGARVWLAVVGGIDLPPVLGSRSTCTAAAFGGMAGRPLQAGDLLPLGRPKTGHSVRLRARRTDTPDAAIEGDIADATPRRLRVTAGPDAHLWQSDPLALLCSTLWRVAVDSDRTGVRLIACDPAIAAALGAIPGIAPSGNPAGAIQVPPDGSAIVLGPDRPVTGGYARAAIIASVDQGVLAALLPGDRVRIEPLSLEDALRLRAALDRARRGDAPPVDGGRP